MRGLIAAIGASAMMYGCGAAQQAEPVNPTHQQEERVTYQDRLDRVMLELEQGQGEYQLELGGRQVVISLADLDSHEGADVVINMGRRFDDHFPESGVMDVTFYDFSSNGYGQVEGVEWRVRDKNGQWAIRGVATRTVEQTGADEAIYRLVIDGAYQCITGSCGETNANSFEELLQRSRPGRDDLFIDMFVDEE